MTESLRKFKLAAFDFDHTIIDVNSDIYINKITHNKTGGAEKIRYPSDIEELSNTLGWTARMNGVFDHLLTKYNAKKEDFHECLKEIKIDDSMISLFKHLNQNGYEMIIISDANSFFIDTILKENGVEHLFSKIYTNPATFDQNECLKATPFNQIFNQNGEAFKCSTQICEKNMCKGEILKAHIETKVNPSEIEHLIYVGDGRNDYCPGLYLKEGHFYFVRKNLRLEALLNNESNGLKSKIVSKIFYWNNAANIIENLN